MIAKWLAAHAATSIATIECAALDLGSSSQIMNQVEHNELHTKEKLGKCQKLKTV